MALRKLTKRNYLGVGHVHRFIHDTTGEILYEPTTKEQYDSMDIKGGHVNVPSKKGYTWQYSSTGTYKVDTPSTMLGEDEYVVVDGKAHCRFAEGNNRDSFAPVELKEISVTDEIDEVKILEAKQRMPWL